MTARSTYEMAAATAQTNYSFAGVAGQANGTLIPNNTQQFPSFAAIEAAYASGIITTAQRVGLRHATSMNAQVYINSARSTLQATGDVGPG